MTATHAKRAKEGMRILHVIRTLDPAWGGPVEGVRNIANTALDQNYAVEILCLDDPMSSWLTPWRPVVHAVGKSSSTYGLNRNLDRWFKENLFRFDAVIVNGIWMYFSIALWKAARRARVPYFLFIHGALDPWFKRRYPLKHLKKCIYWAGFEHKVMRDAAAVFFTTEEEKQLAHNAFQPYRCNPVVTGYGVANPNLSPTFDKTNTIRNLTLAHPGLQNRNFLLFLARIHEKKGIDLLLKAFAATKNSLPGTAVLVAGPGDKALINKLTSLSKGLGIAGDVVWTGPLYDEEKWDALRAAEAYVLPSHQENFGISVVESLACGTPVLISDKVNIWREVEAAGAGFAAPDSIQGTIDLLKLWSQTAANTKNSMSAAAIQCFESHFDIEKTSLQIYEFIRHKLGELQQQSPRPPLPLDKQ